MVFRLVFRKKGCDISGVRSALGEERVDQSIALAEKYCGELCAEKKSEEFCSWQHDLTEDFCEDFKFKKG